MRRMGDLRHLQRLRCGGAARHYCAYQWKESSKPVTQRPQSHSRIWNYLHNPKQSRRRPVASNSQGPPNEESSCFVPAAVIDTRFDIVRDTKVIDVYFIDRRGSPRSQHLTSYMILEPFVQCLYEITLSDKGIFIPDPSGLPAVPRRCRNKRRVHG
jgi:hypothetical protein